MRLSSSYSDSDAAWRWRAPSSGPRLLLVLDEPEARLDVDGVRWLGEKLVAEKAAGRGILLVSHDPDLVEQVCDRVVRLGGSTTDDD